MVRIHHWIATIHWIHRHHTIIRIIRHTHLRMCSLTRWWDKWHRHRHTNSRLLRLRHYANIRNFTWRFVLMLLLIESFLLFNHHLLLSLHLLLHHFLMFSHRIRIIVLLIRGRRLVLRLLLKWLLLKLLLLLLSYSIYLLLLLLLVRMCSTILYFLF